MEAGFHRAVRRRLDRGGPIGDRPVRVYALFRDRPAAPALFALVEYEGRPVPVIVHNFRYYERSMDRWDAGFIELLVLNELHELTHWAMTEEERIYFEERSRRTNRPDGFWLNRTLFPIIDWLPGQPRRVMERRSRWRRLLTWLRSLIAGE